MWNAKWGNIKLLPNEVRTKRRRRTSGPEQGMMKKKKKNATAMKNYYFMLQKIYSTKWARAKKNFFFSGETFSLANEENWNKLCRYTQFFVCVGHFFRYLLRQHPFFASLSLRFELTIQKDFHAMIMYSKGEKPIVRKDWKEKHIHEVRSQNAILCVCRHTVAQLCFISGAVHKRAKKEDQSEQKKEEKIITNCNSIWLFLCGFGAGENRA